MKKWKYFASAAVLFIIGVVLTYMGTLASMLHSGDEWDALSAPVKAAWASGGLISLCVAVICFAMTIMAILDGLD